MSVYPRPPLELRNPTAHNTPQFQRGGKGGGQQRRGAGHLENSVAELFRSGNFLPRKKVKPGMRGKVHDSETMTRGKEKK